MEFPERAVEPIREEALRTEIRQYETHLAHIAAEDDSAYGKARIRLYETLLQERREQLDVLAGAPEDDSSNRDSLIKVTDYLR